MLLIMLITTTEHLSQESFSSSKGLQDGALTVDMKVCSFRTEVGGALAVWAGTSGSGLGFSSVWVGNRSKQGMCPETGPHLTGVRGWGGQSQSNSPEP